MKWRYPMLACACLAVLGGPLPVRGDVDVTELASDRFGYAGTYTKYDSLSDLQNNLNGTAGAVSQRDLGLYFMNNSPGNADANYFLTAWYYTTTGPSDGYGNPNNTDLSFIQIANPATSGQPLIGTSHAYWTSSALNQFAISASGGNADTANSAARFGDEGSANKPSSATAGTFLSYNLNATFSGLNTAVYNSTTGAYESTGDPSGITVSGNFSAIFENTSTSNPTSNGFYKIDLTLNNTSWAYQNMGDLTVYPFQTSLFGASSIAPEPSSFVTALVVGSLGALGYTWRRRRGASSSTVA